MKKHYYTNCVESTEIKINAMIEQSREITYRTFLKHVSYFELIQIFPQYAITSKLGLTMKNDWAVSFYKSKYCGKNCVYMCHSAIEYIFI